MAIAFHRTESIELAPARPRRGQLPRQYRSADSLSVPALKTGLLGGCTYLTLFVIGLNPLFENLAYIFPASLVLFGFSVVGLGTGLLAAHTAEPAVRRPYQQLEAGWLAGFWAGLIVGLVAMLLAAQGLLMAHVGESLLSNFSPAQLALWQIYGWLGPLVVAGRVGGALLVYGLLGSHLSAILGAIGAWLYISLDRDRLDQKDK
jgi:hypothetical protein